MEQYNVTGMSCAACSARVEKAVSKVEGVTSCSVSLLTNSMGVEGTASSGEIIKAVQPDSIETEDGIALIAVVGRGMCRTRGVAARIFAALAHAHINVRMIDQGSSELNVIVAVKETDFEQAIRCIYEMFVNSVA